MQDELRAVIEAARAWRKYLSPVDLTDAEEALCRAVNALEDALVIHGKKRSAGFVVKSTWGEVEPGWWVRSPKGDFYEVVDTETSGGTLTVSFRVGDRVAPYPRDPHASVWVRKRTKADVPADAIQLLKDTFGAEIIGEYTSR